MLVHWPENKKFAFTVVDDTDNSTIENIKPVYDFLFSHEIKTTKTVWVYPSKNKYSGGYLLDDEYLDFILDLGGKGYEIGLHNVGSGEFNRVEIINGLKIYNQKLGTDSNIQINHASNPDNIYWGSDRYQLFLRSIINFLYKEKRTFYGTNINSNYFWGDYCKKRLNILEIIHLMI